jgi:hypothetical protein
MAAAAARGAPCFTPSAGSSAARSRRGPNNASAPTRCRAAAGSAPPSERESASWFRARVMCACACAPRPSPSPPPSQLPAAPPSPERPHGTVPCGLSEGPRCAPHSSQSSASTTTRGSSPAWTHASSAAAGSSLNTKASLSPSPSHAAATVRSRPNCHHPGAVHGSRTLRSSAGETSPPALPGASRSRSCGALRPGCLAAADSRLPDAAAVAIRSTSARLPKLLGTRASRPRAPPRSARSSSTCAAARAARQRETTAVRGMKPSSPTCPQGPARISARRAHQASRERHGWFSSVPGLRVLPRPAVPLVFAQFPRCPRTMRTRPVHFLTWWGPLQM